MIVVEEKVKGKEKRQKRIAALGGHGFTVPSPPGHKIIQKEQASQFAPLLHETDKRAEIEESGHFSAMHHSGGINFSVHKSGGY